MLTMKATLFTLTLWGVALGAASQTLLPNGITLPAQWPPHREPPVERCEMEVPYLTQKPAVLPIRQGRQLFVDTFLIAETNLTRVCHTPTFYSGNPVVEPDRPWENTVDGAPYAAPFSDGVWYDERQGKYRMWYLAGAGTLHPQEKQTFYTCYAESDDGKHWRKPNQDVVPGTNIVEPHNRDAATVWLDRSEADSAKRWKAFHVEPRDFDHRWQVVLRYSSDGIHWGAGVAQSGDVSDRTTAFYNPLTRKWVLSLRAATPVSNRSRYYAEHEDPEMLVSLAHRVRSDMDDKYVVYWFSPDDKELRHERFPEVEPGIYNFDVIPYESILLGFYSAWAGPENQVCAREGIQKRNVISLGYSRDGFHFSRPTHQPFLNVDETDGAWNWGNMQSVNGAPLIVGDSLYFYCSGRRLNDIMWDSYTSTGLATLRRDGFVSLHAGKQEGYLTTEPLLFDSRHFFVNVDVRRRTSSLRVEVLDSAGHPLEGYSGRHAAVVRQVDATRCRLVWPQHADLSALTGQPVRFRFRLTDGDLYAFWVSPWESGESRGFTAGGGPGLSADGIDHP